MRLSFVEKLISCAFTADSIVASFSSSVPASEEMACCSRANCAWVSAKPLFTAASMSASFVSRLDVWDLTAAEMASSFSSSVPLIEATACCSILTAVWLSARPSRCDASISATLSASGWLDWLMASRTPR